MPDASRNRPLERRILDVIQGGANEPLPDDTFNRLALDVFRFQYGANEPYRRFCDHRAASPATVESWKSIPAVPAAAFKELPLTCFPPEAATHVFTTSGTTAGAERQGTHYLLTSELYDASLLSHFAAALLPDGARLPMFVLAQPPAGAPHSSLSHMFGIIERTLGNDCTYYVDERGLDFAAIERDLALAEAEATPVMLLGTAFAFVHLLDHCAPRGVRFSLARRSRLMDTGGFKGRSREVSRDELYAAYRDRFGIAAQYLVNEYGMTELGSQCYDATLEDHEARRRRARRKLAPSWCRFTVVDPETLEIAEPGEPGILRFFDLTNLYSVSAIQSEDLGRVVEDGFELHGRAQGAEARGCSIALDELLLAQRQ